jgi:hypothetical protein
MSCPTCAGVNRRPIAPNYFECTSLVNIEMHGVEPSRSIPPHLGIVEPVTFVVTQPCGVRYHEGPAPLTPPCRCSTYSIGTCTRCKRPVCGDCSRLREQERWCTDCEDAERERCADEARVREAAERAVEDREAGEHAVRLEARRGDWSVEEIHDELRRLEIGRFHFNTYGQHDGLMLLLVAGAFLGPAIAGAMRVAERAGRGPLFNWGNFSVVFVLLLVGEIAVVSLVSWAHTRRRQHRLRELRDMLHCEDPTCRRCRS